ncbi:hypothetical protein DEU56DRAFT_873408 [Suillus clintonianus]|uniref:uncharacterized protein n=1 Tax=Suillus clintonianus TaxID=1904413 RepID=UPI001B86F727|nr:uncharacterized protein DEU56DRAFT_873408 [Suillus clintonianus]KAG2123744.1 hypothetical protein DEU56DRAFT_873408 [Suillus clintonianus]
MRTLIAEAQLEVGPDHEDPMDHFDDSMYDDSGDQHNEDDGEALDVPLTSQFLATAAQQSDYFIPEAAVEHFKDDVRNRPGQRSPHQNTSCTNNWTAARSVEEAKISVFEQTGIFIMACRHGLVECIVEMKQSGELAKYGLAAVDRLLDSCGSLQGLGHDIGCASRKTIAASSIGAKAEELNLIVAVNAFHGYAHNRRRFLHNNYVQALRIINEYTPLLHAFKTRTSFSDEDFVRWKAEESEFLTNLALEPPFDAFAVAYVEELEKLRSMEAKYGSVTSVPFLTYTPANFTQSSGLDATTRDSSRAVEAERASALQRLQLQMNVVDDFECHYGINKRWVSSDPQYIQAREYCSQRRFTRAVEQLEGLVIQRLFELSRANLSGTGYKMRKHISKAIARRSGAIRTALEKYNTLAPIQVPPRPTLDYTEVVGEMAAKFFKVLHSHEELMRLNIEISRLSAWVDFEEKEILSAIDALNAVDSDLLAAELQMHYVQQHRLNDVHRARLHRTSQLSGYTGPPLFALLEREETDDEGDDEDEDEGSDELLDEASRLEDTISRIVLQ